MGLVRALDTKTFESYYNIICARNPNYCPCPDVLTVLANDGRGGKENKKKQFL